MNIIKPSNDENNYKYYVLDNNIKCILINDTSLDKSYVIASVNVGSITDTEYYYGMAHLLEHMCFITSNKYKKKNYLHNKISESGGSSNAYTAELNTLYYLDIFTENLESILKIFIDFLTNAELKEEYISDELNNVDSEHKKNINNDGWRQQNLERMLANPKSNFNHFGTGTNETLRKPDLYKKMRDFYDKYYNTNNLSVCIASNKSIDELYKIANKFFGKIKKSDINKKSELIRPLYTENKGKTFLMEPVNDIKKLIYIFEIEDYDIKDKSYNLLVNILNSSEENSCNEYLKSLGLIDELYCHIDTNSIFKIEVILTNVGINKINEINTFIINAVNNIFLMDWKKILSYNKKRFNFLFNNSNKREKLDLSIALLENLLYYDPVNIYYGDYDYKTNIGSDKTNIKALLEKNINFDKCIRIIITKNIKLENKIFVDKFYGTKYCELNIFNNNKLELININYSLINKYSNYEPYINNSNQEIPILIKKNICYGSTTKFNELNIYSNIIFSNKNYFNNIKNYILTLCSVDIINYYLKIKLYKASEYNYDVKLEMLDYINSIVLNMVFYDINFINDVLNLLNNKMDINDKLILSKILIIKDQLKSLKYLNPWSFCNYIFDKSYVNSYFYEDLLKELNKININEIKIYIKQIIKNTGIKIFIYGNSKIENIPKLNIISNRNYLDEFPKIRIKKKIIYTHPNPNETNNCVKISYFVCKFNPKKNLYLLFIKLITHNLFFDDLRTNKKLGYLVGMGSSIIGKQYYIYQKIQSDKSCNEIYNYINEFNNKLIENIKKIDLDMWKETVINYLTEKENNTEDFINKYYSEILNKTYIFNRNELLLKYIDKINID